MPPYKGIERFPVAEELSSKGVSLPLGVTLVKKDVVTIAGAIKEIR